ncbi:MAG: Flp family type IVb pilin [Armatimonadota bacterium]|nr:Flp family type IVb pilin [Armatimonadota bacterium]
MIDFLDFFRIRRWQIIWVPSSRFYFGKNLWRPRLVRHRCFDTCRSESLQHFILDERGQTLVEYGLLISLIALIVIGVLSTMGKRASNTFNGTANEFPGNKNGPPGPIGNPNQ